MKFTRNIKAISKLLLILLLLTATIIGAVLSYLWVIGYFISLGIRVPDKTTVSITNATFNPQDTSYFNVTLLNPSYSPSDANITRIVTSTEEGGKEVIHLLPYTDPQLPYQLPKAKSATFQCFWNWANYTGETIKIIAFIEDGSGPTFEIEAPLVDLKITDVQFNSTISVTRFNLTVQNGNTSVTYVDINGVIVGGETISVGNLSVSLPHTLDPNESVSFTCMWNWTNYQDKNVTVEVRTMQGYVAYRTHLTPKPVNLTITNVLFNVTDTTHFNVTVHNSEHSSTYVNITRITATRENGTVQEIAEVNPSLTPSYPLEAGANVTFRCLWNWTDYRGKNATITVYTLQNFTVSSNQTTTARVILEITDIFFDVDNPSYFNVTVRNSEFSLEEYVNITRVTVAVENVILKNITKAETLYADESVTLNCSWNWVNHWNEEVSVSVRTLQGYSAYGVEVTPSPVIISDVNFELSDTTHFNVTVENSEFFSGYVLVTNVTVTLENGTVRVVTVIPPTRLPYVLHPSNSVMFMCSWNWSDYCDRNVTVTVYTLQGYTANYTIATPEAVFLIITNVYFPLTNTTYFNFDVINYMYSLTPVNITRISVTLQNGTGLNATFEPSLPYLLSQNATVTFKCLWNWAAYQGEFITIKVETLEGYEFTSSGWEVRP